MQLHNYDPYTFKNHPTSLHHAEITSLVTRGCEGKELHTLLSTAKGWPVWKQLTATAERFMLVAGWGHTMVMVNNQLLTWGYNGHGQLGIGNTNQQLQPVKVAMDKSFVAIAAGFHHSLALSDTGELLTWGYNDHGQLGIGNTNQQLQPVKVAMDKSFVAIAAGQFHSLALSDTGELLIWGYNGHGQLGIGNTNQQLQPVKVAMDKIFVAIAAGQFHSLALSDTGELLTWGLQWSWSTWNWTHQQPAATSESGN